MMFARAPRWYRGLPSWLTDALAVLVVVGAIALAIGITWRHSLAHARANERAEVVRESAQWIAATNGAWRVQLDSARAATADKSSALDSVSARARSLASRIAALSKQSADSLNSAPTIKESLLVAARADSATAVVERDDAPTLRACGVHLDALAQSCSEFRASATRTIAVQDSALQAGATRDSVRAVQLATITRSDAAKALALTKRPTWWTVTKGAAFGAAVGLLVGVFQ